jgi:hypothetical protein
MAAAGNRGGGEFRASHADREQVTADLHVEPVAAQSSQVARNQGEAPVLRPGPVLAAATAVYASVWALAVLPSWPVNSEDDPPRAVIFLVFSTTIVYLLVLAITVGNMAADWIQKRSDGQPARDAGGR